MDTTTELQRPVEAGHDVLITPTASARKELPPERYQITRGAVINQVSYHVACHNALLRSAERANPGKRMGILNDAERTLVIAEKTIEELEALASDEDVDYVLAYMKRVHHWEPRDIRPKKMERTRRQVRAGHKLPTVGNQPDGTYSPGPGEPARYFHPDKNLPYIHTHKLEPWIWVGADGACWLFHAPLAPGWTVKDNEHLGPLLVAPKDLPHEAYHAQNRVPLALGKQPANGKVKMMVQRILDREAVKRKATNAANVTNKTIGRKLKKKLGHQAGDVLPDGTMVVDPTNAIQDLHDLANPVTLKVEAVPPGKTIEQLLPAANWVPPNGEAATNLTELAKPFGADRRAREVVKKRFTSLFGKLAKLDAEERAAFLSYVNTKLQ